MCTEAARDVGKITRDRTNDAHMVSFINKGDNLTIYINRIHLLSIQCFPFGVLVAEDLQLCLVSSQLDVVLLAVLETEKQQDL